MVAHGTIAFDTLTTSDQIGTGTEKSIDTSYLHHGVGKSWLGSAHHGNGNISGENFNISSYEDTATGRGRPSMTNGLTRQYSVVAGSESNYIYQSYDVTTTQFEVSTVNSSGNYADGVNNAVCHGDLA